MNLIEKGVLEACKSLGYSNIITSYIMATGKRECGFRYKTDKQKILLTELHNYFGVHGGSKRLIIPDDGKNTTWAGYKDDVDSVQSFVSKYNDGWNLPISALGNNTSVAHQFTAILAAGYGSSVRAEFVGIDCYAGYNGVSDEEKIEMKIKSAEIYTGNCISVYYGDKSGKNRRNIGVSRSRNDDDKLLVFMYDNVKYVIKPGVGDSLMVLNLDEVIRYKDIGFASLFKGVSNAIKRTKDVYARSYCTNQTLASRLGCLFNHDLNSHLFEFLNEKGLDSLVPAIFDVNDIDKPNHTLIVNVHTSDDAFDAIIDRLSATYAERMIKLQQMMSRRIEAISPLVTAFKAFIEGKFNNVDQYLLLTFGILRTNRDALLKKYGDGAIINQYDAIQSQGDITTQSPDFVRDLLVDNDVVTNGILRICDEVKRGAERNRSIDPRAAEAKRNALMTSITQQKRKF